MAVEAAGFYLGAVAAEGDGEGGATVGDAGEGGLGAVGHAVGVEFEALRGEGDAEDVVEDEAEIACGAPGLMLFFVPQAATLPAAAGLAFDGVDLIEVALAAVDGEVGKVFQLEIERLPEALAGTARGIEHVDVRPYHKVVAAGAFVGVAGEGGIDAGKAVGRGVGLGDHGCCLVLRQEVEEEREGKAEALLIVVGTACVVDKIVGTVLVGAVEVEEYLILKEGGTAEVFGGMAARLFEEAGHVVEAAIGLIIDSVGAEALDGGGIGVMKHVGVVPLDGVIDGLVVACYAVLKDGGAHEEAVGGVETLRLKLAHGGSGTVVGLAEEEGVARDEEMMMCGEGPDDLVPILMADAEAVVGDAPERFFGHLGAEEAEGVPGIDGTVARPLSAIAPSGMDEAVVGVVVYGPYGKTESAVDERIAALQLLCGSTGSKRGEEQERKGNKGTGDRTAHHDEEI